MYKYTIEHTIKEVMSVKTFLLLALFAFFCISDLDFARAHQLSAIEYVIHMMSEIYYMSQILFLFLIISFSRLKKNKSIMLLVRKKRFIKYWNSELLSIAIYITTILVLHLLIAITIGYTAFPREMNFTSMPLVVEHPLDVYRSWHHPVNALIAQFSFMAIGFALIAYIIRFLELYLSSRLVTLLTLGFYIGVFVALRTTLNDTIYYLLANNYILLHNAWDNLASTLITMVAIFLIITALVKKGWRIKRYV